MSGASSWQWRRRNERALLKSFWKAMNENSTLHFAMIYDSFLPHWFYFVWCCESAESLIFHSFIAVYFQRVCFSFSQKWLFIIQTVGALIPGTTAQGPRWCWWDLWKGHFCTWFVTSNTAIKCSDSRWLWQLIWPQGKLPQVVPAQYNRSLYRSKLWHLQT